MIQKISPRKVDTYAYMETICELLEEGHEVPLVITGNSMSPFLIHERDQILISKVNRPLKKGDMAFFRRNTGQYIMHRIRYIKTGQAGEEEKYYFIGDAQTVTEGPIARKQIFGVITAVQRKGKTLKKGDFWWEFFEHVWLHIIPLRHVICWAYGLSVGNIKALFRSRIKSDAEK